MADTTRLLLNSPLINYIHYKTGNNAGKLADGAEISFFENDDHTKKLDTFKDAEGQVVNDNPITLPDGSYPPIYMQNKLYYIEIHDKYGNLILSIDDYVPNGNGSGGGGGGVTKQDANIIANAQFNYPLNFSLKGDNSVNGEDTPIAYSWHFNQDTKTTTKNLVTFNALTNAGFEANPQFQFQLESQSPDSGETIKDLRQVIGTVDNYQTEFLTVAIDAINLSSVAASIEVIINKNYGTNGSSPESITVANFTLTSANQVYTQQFQLPTNTGKTIGFNNYLEISFRFPLKTTCKIGITNILLLPGQVAKPVITEIGYSDYAAKIAGGIFASTLAYNDLENSNYTHATFVNGELDSTYYFPEINLYPIGNAPSNAIRCDGSSHSPNDEIVPGLLTYKRLHNAIGQRFGGGGDLVVTSNANVASFTVYNNIPKSPTQPGNMGSKITIATTQKGLATGVKATVSGTVVTLTWVDDTFTPNATPGFMTGPGGTTTAPIRDGWLGDWFHPGPYGTWAPAAPFIWKPTLNNSITTVVTGAGPNAAATITFNSNSALDYASSVREMDSLLVSAEYFYTNYLEWVSTTNNIRSFGWKAEDSIPMTPVAAANQIFFSIDGKIGDHFSGTENTIIVDLKSSLGSAAQYATAFANAVNINNIDTVTFNATPAAGDNFFISSVDTDFYYWFEVDGAGTDPAIADRDPIKVAITSGDNTTIVAQKLTAATTAYSFKVPLTGTHTPALPGGADGLVDYYILG
jgi:hypothetical protein